MRIVKILAAVLAALIVLLIGAALVIAWTFDPNDYKDHLAGWVEDRTGRELQIDDDLELSFFPWLAVETGGITLGNAPGFEAEPFATIERAQIRVKLMPLLRRQFEIGMVIIDGMALNLGRDAEMVGNWEDLLARLTEETDASQDRSETDLPLESLDIEGFRIRNASLAWRENTTELHYLVSGLNVQTGQIALGVPIELELSLDARDVLAARELQIAGRTTAQLDGDGRIGANTATLDFTFSDETHAQRAQGTLRLASFEQLGGGDGRIEANTVDLDFTFGDETHAQRARGTLRLASFTQMPDGAITLGNTALDARIRELPGAPDDLALTVHFTGAAFDAAAQTLRVDDLNTDTAGIAAAWQIAAERVLDAPELSGSVTIADAPLAQVLSLLDIAPPAGVSADALGTASLSSVFRFDLQPRRLSLSELDARLLGARLLGELELDEANRLQGRIEVPEFAPGAAMLAFIQPQLPADIDASAFGRMSLAARIDSNLDTGRSSFRDLRATLLGATLSGELDITRSGNGQLYRGTLSTSRFAPEAFATAFASLLPEALMPGELGMLALDTRFSYDTNADTVTLDPLRIEAFGLNGSGRVNGRAVSSDSRWTGEAEVQAFSPRDLLNRFAQLAPDTSDPSALTRATVSAGFDVSAERGRFENIVLALDDSRITGNLTVEGFEDPAYVFALAIDRVDADRYLPPRADEVEAGEMTAGDLELEVEALNTLRLSGQIEVGALSLAGMQFQQVATRMEVGGGRAQLDSARARLYGGEFEGRFGVDTRNAQPSMTLSGRASGLNMQPLIEALTGDANLSGTGSFELNLSGRGPKVIDNVRSAGGNLAFTLRDGAISGFNLGRGLCVAYNLTQRAPAPPSDLPRETRYQVIQGTAEVRDGVAHMPDLLGRASFMDVTGSGRLVLAEQHLDYQLEAELTAPIGIRNCETMDPLIGESIPLRVRGPVTGPEIAPDYSEVIERRLRQEVQRRVTDRLQDLIRR